jgi:hypothetical protein
MAVRDALKNVLTAPAVEGLWALRAELLEAGLPQDSRIWPVVDEFQKFLDELATSSTSRDYSELASKLDIGAVSGVVLENVIEKEGAEELGLRLLAGLLSEGLMVAATRQHVKAWGTELDAVYRRSAWFLYGELWRWAQELKPDLPASERRHLLDRLLSPVHSDETAGLSKATLIGLLFQVLLLSYLSSEVTGSPGK